MKVHILDDYFDTLRNLPSFEALAGHDVTVWTDHQPEPAVLAKRLDGAEAVILFRERTPVTAELAGLLTTVKLIAMRGGHPHVDVEALTAAGIAFASEKGEGGPSVAAAELTFALILAAARQLPAQIASARAGHWQSGVGRTLKGRTLGLLGYGRLARMVADYARAFGMNVVVWGSPDGRARAAAAGETVAASRTAFFAEPDFVSLHQRLVPETRHAVTAEDLAAMRSDAVLINTARAGLIAPGALVAALDAGRPGGAAIDVLDGEPVTDPSDPVLSHPKIIATPHIGFVTEDELDRQFADIYALVNAFANGEPRSVINPSVLAAR
ncbi:D-2-hydroxyacid dehydrogenase family protein [Acuticoccus sp. MNP-M23]|uniref:D-2-hydroxyacid dehydrogenase family protein n=1 Tax=Acuticoccus sp. MNP-M23 TaxID=3072793 RepID=UPI00281572A4|nr:D-2-hydroxyacid dehydrogenase family protein [Acuticoccus sp. MNP-M23]WMS44461.1 D-2-hydroxyacid dehydrogenase family protein [Acuticoccus sp. MNP-M23]